MRWPPWIQSNIRAASATTENGCVPLQTALSFPITSCLDVSSRIVHARSDSPRFINRTSEKFLILRIAGKVCYGSVYLPSSLSTHIHSAVYCRRESKREKYCTPLCWAQNVGSSEWKVYTKHQRRMFSEKEPFRNSVFDVLWRRSSSIMSFFLTDRFRFWSKR